MIYTAKKSQSEGQMSIETKYICDVCGAARGETNHWFEAVWVESVGSMALRSSAGAKT